MNHKIHPKWYPDAKVTCVCGNTFTVGASVPELQVEICAACHPFFTGQMKFVDTAGRVDKFKAKQAGADKKVLSKREKRALKKEQKIKEELDRPDTFAEFKAKQKGKKKN